MDLSVIIPTKNRSKYLSELIDSLFLQESGGITWEIIVVDNASTDETLKITKEKTGHSPIPIRYVYESRPGLHHGRHRGTRETEAEYIAFLDDDTLLSPKWITGLDLIRSHQADAVVSRILPKWEITPPLWLTGLITDGKFSFLTLLDLGNDPQEIDPLYVWGASFFIRRSLVYDLGGFHPDGMPPEMQKYRGDGELGFFRLFKRQGYTAWYDPRSVAYHRVSAQRMTLDYLCQRSYNEGISDSYTQIREEHALYSDKLIFPSTKKTKSMKYFMIRAKEMTVADWIKSFENRIAALRRRFLPTQQERIMKRLLFANHAGWKFHQAAVSADPELLAYTLKQNYLDN